MDEFEGFKILERELDDDARQKAAAARRRSQGSACAIVKSVKKFTGPWTKAFGITVEVIPAQRAMRNSSSAEAKIGSAQG